MPRGEGTDTGRLVRDQFGREAEKYRTSGIHRNPDELDQIVRMIPLDREWIALDVATGAGHTAVAIAPYVSKVIAVDITSRMLGQTRRTAEERGVENIVTLEADVHSLPFTDGTFDLVTCRLAAHHFNDIGGSVGEMLRVCRPGGSIFIQDTISPAHGEAKELLERLQSIRDPSHVYDLDMGEWLSLLKDRGAELVTGVRKRAKRWEVDHWTSMMSTPEEGVKEIKRLVLEHADSFPGVLEFEVEGDRMTILPEDALLLFRKR
jgi:SAM-dependent methyltransferase